MRALFLEHDHMSPPGPLAERLNVRGFVVEERVVVPAERYASPNVTFSFPAIDDFDVVVVMGATWGAWDDDTIGAWLQPELQWLADLHRARVPILGICFGGQALARALGGSVSRAPRPEIGFTNVLTNEPELVAPGPWFQFHYDRWTLPPRSVEIARTPLASQAFVLDRTLGLQFHPEVTSAVLDTWMEDENFVASGTRSAVAEDGQDLQVLRAQVAAEEPDSILRAYALLDAFLDRISGLRLP